VKEILDLDIFHYDASCIYGGLYFILQRFCRGEKHVKKALIDFSVVDFEPWS